MTDHLIATGSKRNLDAITGHICGDCLHNAQVSAADLYGTVNHPDVNDEAAFASLQADITKYVAERGAKYAAETGVDNKTVTGHVFLALHGTNVEMFDHVNHKNHPLARLVFLNGMYRAALIDSIAATCIEANNEGFIPDMGGEFVTKIAEAFDKPLSFQDVMEITHIARGLDDDEEAAAPDEPVNSDQEGFNKVWAIFEGGPKGAIRDMLLSKMREVAAERGLTYPGQAPKDPEPPKVTMLGDKSGVIEISGDETPEQMAKIVADAIREQGGPDVPHDEIVKALANGIGIIKIPKQ